MTEPRKCKIDGCDEERLADVGIYAGLCEAHKQQKRAAGPSAAGGGTADGYHGRVREILPAARELDRARTLLNRTAASEKLTEDFREAMRRANVSPTEENLASVEAAAKELRRGASRRETAAARVKTAEDQFKLALGRIAVDFRTAA